MCSPSRAFWGAPRAIVGLKRGGGGWCILASAMPSASSRVGPRTCRSQEGQVRGGGSVTRTLCPLKFQLAPLLGPTRVPPSTLRTPSRRGPAASRPPYLPEQEGQVRGGGRPPGPAERPTRPVLGPTRSWPCGEYACEVAGASMASTRGGVAPGPGRAPPVAPTYSHTAPPGAERLLGRVRPGTRACDSSSGS